MSLNRRERETPRKRAVPLFELNKKRLKRHSRFMQIAQSFLHWVKSLQMSIMLALPFASYSQVIDPDWPVALSRIDPNTGHIKWSFKFPQPFARHAAKLTQTESSCFCTAKTSLAEMTYGQLAATAAPTWEFILPKDVPSQPFPSAAPQPFLPLPSVAL